MIAPFPELIERIRGEIPELDGVVQRASRYNLWTVAPCEPNCYLAFLFFLLTVDFV